MGVATTSRGRVWFSCASGLFMFPAVYTYLFRAIEVRGVAD